MTIPLPLWPWPMTPERLALLKQAKATLTDLDILVVPVEAAPSGPGRVLAFGGRPPFACDYAPIGAQNVDRVESIAAALRYTLTAAEDQAPFNRAQWLSEVMGGEVTQITDPFRLDVLEHQLEMDRLRRQGVPV